MYTVSIKVVFNKGLEAYNTNKFVVLIRVIEQGTSVFDLV